MGRRPRPTWKDRPRHDWASHGYKGFETAAVCPDQFDEEELETADDSGRSEVGGY
jgi:hypothetical protein